MIAFLAIDINLRSWCNFYWCCKQILALNYLWKKYFSQCFRRNFCLFFFSRRSLLRTLLRKVLSLVSHMEKHLCNSPGMVQSTSEQVWSKISLISTIKLMNIRYLPNMIQILLGCNVQDIYHCHNHLDNVGIHLVLSNLRLYIFEVLRQKIFHFTAILRPNLDI